MTRRRLSSHAAGSTRPPLNWGRAAARHSTWGSTTGPPSSTRSSAAPENCEGHAWRSWLTARIPSAVRSGAEQKHGYGMKCGDAEGGAHWQSRDGPFSQRTATDPDTVYVTKPNRATPLLRYNRATAISRRCEREPMVIDTFRGHTKARTIRGSGGDIALSWYPPEPDHRDDTVRAELKKGAAMFYRGEGMWSQGPVLRQHRRQLCCFVHGGSVGYEPKAQTITLVGSPGGACWCAPQRTVVRRPAVSVRRLRLGPIRGSVNQAGELEGARNALNTSSSRRCFSPTGASCWSHPDAASPCGAGRAQGQRKGSFRADEYRTYSPYMV